jgi:hypothetical protein
MQTLGCGGGRNRHGCIRFVRQQIRYRIGGRRQLEIRGIDDFFGERSAASDTNGLRAVVSFLASRSCSFSCLRSTEVFGARKFVAGIVDNFVRMKLGRRVGAKAVDLARESDRGEYQEQLQKQARNKPTVSDDA